MPQDIALWAEIEQMLSLNPVGFGNTGIDHTHSV